MRLTSYNMAVKILHAKDCLADMVDRMWAYMEEGDTDKAQCVREKALGLYALMETAGRWRPTITDGKSYKLVFGTGTITAPAIVGTLAYNGVRVSNSGILFGDDNEVTHGLARLFNCHLQDDDLIDFRNAVITSEPYNAVSGTLFVSDALLPLTTSEITTFGFVGGASEMTDETVFEDAEPYCLTDSQIHSVIGKIDELCECKC